MPSGRKFCLATALIMLSLIAIAPEALAAKYVAKSAKVSVYAKKSKKSKVLTTVKKGNTLSVTSSGKKWLKVKANGKVGFVLKSSVKKAASAKSNPKANSKAAPKKPAKKITVKEIQNKLANLGYLKTSSITGSINSATKKAVRVFKALNNMKVNSKANTATRRKIISRSSKPNIDKTTWSRSAVKSRMKRGEKAKIVDLATGRRIKIRRVGGHNHLDVEPATAKDTKKLKSVYNGKWSWDSRAILLKAEGRFYSAAMNGMPHGSQISKSNNFKGQFCIHLDGSTTHGTKKANSYHQRNIDKAYNYLSTPA